MKDAMKDTIIENLELVLGEELKKKNLSGKFQKDLEELLDSKVYLELFVKVIKKWRDKEKYLSEFGYKEIE